MGGLIGLGCARSRRKISPYVTQTAIQLLGTAHHAVAVGGQGSGASSPDGCLARLVVSHLIRHTIGGGRAMPDEGIHTSGRREQ